MFSSRIQGYAGPVRLLAAAGLLAVVAPVLADGNPHFDMGQWRQYLAEQLDPGLSTVDLDRHPVPASFDWKAAARNMMLPDFAQALFRNRDRQFTTYSLSGHSAAMNVWSTNIVQPPKLQLSGLQQHFYAPGLAAAFNRDGVFAVGMVFAEQRYASGLLDQSEAFYNRERGYYDRLSRINEPLNSPFANNQLLHSRGMGLSLGYSYSVLPWMELQTSYRSKINTEAGHELVGLYADPAELDLPARLGASMSMAVADKHVVSFGVERVQYSNVDSFISRLLPGDLLSLLGDSSSPAFIWSDLNIYSASWQYRPDDDWDLRMQITTRTQPLPQSAILADALRPSLTDRTYGLFATRRFGADSALSLGVTYAPADITFGGSSLGIVTEDLNNNFEFDLRYTLRY